MYVYISVRMFVHFLMSSRTLSFQLLKPSKKIPLRDSHKDHLKKKPMKRRFDESDDEDAIGMIRKMFRFVAITTSLCVSDDCLTFLPSLLDMKLNL